MAQIKLVIHVSTKNVPHLYALSMPAFGFAAHGRLYGYRRGVKEIFRCNYALARKALLEAAEGYLGEDEWESRYALLRYTFADE
jgi:hypothetical protein